MLDETDRPRRAMPPVKVRNLKKTRSLLGFNDVWVDNKEADIVDQCNGLEEAVPVEKLDKFPFNFHTTNIKAIEKESDAEVRALQAKAHYRCAYFSHIFTAKKAVDNHLFAPKSDCRNLPRCPVRLAEGKMTSSGRRTSAKEVITKYYSLIKYN